MTYYDSLESNPQCQDTWYLSQPAEPAEHAAGAFSHSCVMTLQLWLSICSMYMCAGTMTNPGVVWEHAQLSCQVLAYAFCPTLYINTVCDLVQVYLSLFRCYLGQFQCGNLALIRCTPRGIVPVWELLCWQRSPVGPAEQLHLLPILFYKKKKVLTGDHKWEEMLCANTNCLTLQ